MPLSDVGMNIQTALRSWVYRKDFALLLQLLDPKAEDVILDVGAGIGLIANRVANLCDDVYALEPNEERLEFIKRKYPQVKAFSGVAEQVPFPNSYFHKVYVISAFHHFSDQEGALEEFSRLVRRGGLLLIHEQDPSRPSFATRLEKRFVQGVKFLAPQELQEKIELHGFEGKGVSRAHHGYFLSATRL